jgi:hypothetical protein
VSSSLFSIIVILSILAEIPIAHAQDFAHGIRTEVPIQQITLSDGTIRYWIPVKIGNTSVNTLLDSGTTGLRILPGAISGSDAPKGQIDRLTVASGTVLVGEVTSGTIQIGSISGLSPFQSIKKIECVFRASTCPSAHVPFEEYGLGAEGLPGEGFHAIIGVKAGLSSLANPLLAIGVTRWIIELPRPGDSTPGKLVLNPRDDEAGDYVYIPVGGPHTFGMPDVFTHIRGNITKPERDVLLPDAMGGCLQIESGAKACGALTFDTGYPAVDVINGPISVSQGALPENTKAELTIFDGNEPRAATSFEAGIKAQASQVFVTKHGPQNFGTVIFAGAVPYFAFDVLYESNRNRIGLKPRPIAAGLPAGKLLLSQ